MPSEAPSQQAYDALYEKLMGPTPTSQQITSVAQHSTAAGLSDNSPSGTLTTSSLAPPGYTPRLKQSSQGNITAADSPTNGHLTAQPSPGSSSTPTAIQPEFADCFSLVTSAIAAWPRRIPLLDQYDSQFVQECAEARSKHSGEVKTFNHQQKTVTYLVNANGAEVYKALWSNPRSQSRPRLQPSLQRHISDLRNNHKTRSKVPGSKIQEVVEETQRRCILMVRSELGAAMG